MGSKYSSTFDESKPPIPEVNFHINGKKYTICPDGMKISATTTLNTFIRNVAELKGTKIMCSEGGCGSCIVAAQFIHPLTQREVLIAVNSCLVSVLSCQGWSITTIEGIGNNKKGYNKLQKRLAEFNGSQCGFCSPGMIMNMYCLQKNEKNLTQKDIENSFGGNICRCTGYRSISEAFKSFANDADPTLKAKCTDIENINECFQRHSLCDGCELIDKSQKYLVINLGIEKWFKVYTILELVQIISVIKNMKYMLVAGNTAHGVYRRDPDIKVYVDVNHIAELHDIQINKNLVVGANTTIADAIKLFNKISSERYEFGYLKEVADHYELVANIPVRNIGTLAGNLMLKHNNPRFQSDIFLTLETFRAKLQIVSKDGNVLKSYSPQDFLSLDMHGKVIVSIKFYPLNKNYVYRTYKIMPRAQSVYAIVNAGFLFELKADNVTVSNATIVYGAINKNFTHAKKTEKLLTDKNLFDDETLQSAFKCLDLEIICDEAAPEPEPEQRKQLAIALFYKFILSIAPSEIVGDYFKSGGYLLERPVSSSHHFYQTEEKEYPLTKPIRKLEAMAQCAGEAKYIIDHDVSRSDFTFGSFVLARTNPGSNIKSINVDEAMKFPGVLTVLLSSDIPGDNSFTPTQAQFLSLEDEEIFCSGNVKYNGQPVGLVVAETEEIARRASSLVEVEYDQSVSKDKLVYTTQDSVNITNNSRIKHVTTINRIQNGNDVKKTIHGKFNIGHQYHFTMETQSCITVPTEDGLNVFPSTQWMDIAQSAIARCCNVPDNRINMNVRRLGGGYGSKITRANLVCCASAIAAIKLKQPVYIRMSLEDNTEVLGKRFPCLSEYEVGVDENGKIQFLTTSIWSNLGYLSNEAVFLGIIPEAMTSCYDASTWEINLYTVTTDVPTNTSCRAPGTNEGIALIETIMDHIATEINKDVREVRLQNMKLENNPLPTLLSEFEKESNLEERLLSCKEFNQNNRWKKRGIGVATITWPFELFSNFYSQVVIYGDDGTVAISHGGMEMGQGINTRVAQAAAYTLKIDLDMIQIKPTNNFNAPNNFLTGGSATSTSVCFATIEACKILLKRLQPIKNKMQIYNWQEMIRESRKQNIDLSATYQFNPFTDKRITNYKVYGVTFSEVEVDILTGQHLLKRVDILEDVGQSINPEIDIGQIEGAFCFGLGYWLTEEVLFDKNDGKLLNNRTWNYHVPGMKDIPIDWRISFRKNAPNLQGVLRSKATGEPPLCMSISVPLAIRQALISARKESDPTQTAWFEIDGPTTISTVLMNGLPKYDQYRLHDTNRVVVKL